MKYKHLRYFNYYHKNNIIHIPYSNLNKKVVLQILLNEIIPCYIHNRSKQYIFKQFVYSYLLNKQFNSFITLFNIINHFIQQNNIALKLNNHTERYIYNCLMKITPIVFENVLALYLKQKNHIVKLSDGIEADIICDGLLIDAKTKNGNSFKVNKDWQISIAYNSLYNHNQSDYFCFSFFSNDFFHKYNEINFTIAGIIKRNEFFHKAFIRQKGDILKDTNGNIIKRNNRAIQINHKDFFGKVNMLYDLNSIF